MDVVAMRVLGIFLLIGVVVAKHEVYDGHAVYQLNVRNIAQVKQLNEIFSEVDVDVWAHAIPGRSGQVLVGKDLKAKFEEALKTAGVEYEVKVENVKELLDREDKLLAEAAASNTNKSSGIDFDRIYTYEEVDALLEELALKYPELVSVGVAGSSFQGRPIKYLKISTTKFEDKTKPIVYIESLLHAREWIGLPVTLYAIEKLVIDVQEQDLVQDIDWIILPVANPDGYVHTHRRERFWRKNRSTGHMIGNICRGVDLNRNFDTNWSAHSSDKACSDVFHGKGPNSEPETAAIANIIHENLDRMQAFFDIHAAGSWLLYGYGSGTLPPNGLILHMVGVQMANAVDAVKVDYNPNYVVGNIAATLYESSGSAPDYAQEVGVPFAYTYELPGSRQEEGEFDRFLVDPEFIEQAGFETWEGLKVGARYVRDNFRRKKGYDSQL